MAIPTKRRMKMPREEGAEGHLDEKENLEASAVPWAMIIMGAVVGLLIVIIIISIFIVVITITIRCKQPTKIVHQRAIKMSSLSDSENQ